MRNEIDHKYKLLRRLKVSIKTTTAILHQSLTPLLKLALYYTIHKSIQSYHKSITTTHSKKLAELKSKSPHHKPNPLPQNTVHNFSSHTLTTDEKNALSYTLDEHIPPNKNPNSIHTEFERFYQNVVRSSTDLPEEQKTRLKTKLRNTCDRYSNVKTRYEYQKTISNLAKNPAIQVIKQDKGRGVIILENDLYTQKCTSLLTTTQFKKLAEDPTRKTEAKVQRAIRKIKAQLLAETYKQIYPTGSNPGKFYGTAKLHKLKPGQNEEHLPLRPIVSNIGTSTYHLAKYLAKLLQPLGKSAYTVSSTEDFINKWKTKVIPPGFKLVSFDVVSLFTNVPLNKTIDIILRRIYQENAIQTSIKQSDLKCLLLLCTKHVHFTFNGETYIQTDGVAMGSPLGSILSDICMVDLENTIIPLLIEIIRDWSRYVDDTIGIVKEDSIEEILNSLNSFHPSIQFTYEIEQDYKIPFLDVMLLHTNTSIETTVYRKPTNNNLYINWDAYAPDTWKRGTLRTLTRRAYNICSNPTLLKEELQHIRHTFHTINGYPHNVINQIFNSVKHSHTNPPQAPPIPSPQTDHPATTPPSKHLLLLPYKGKTGDSILKSMRRTLKSILPPTSELQTCYTSTKLASKFTFKDKTEPQHQHNVIYMSECPNEECNSTYIGETARRLEERHRDHTGRDQHSHVLKHALETGHQLPTLDKMKIIGNKFRNNWTRKIEEALAIKRLKPTLNKQEKSVELKLLD